jgi:hypothetical protein
MSVADTFKTCRTRGNEVMRRWRPTGFGRTQATETAVIACSRSSALRPTGPFVFDLLLLAEVAKFIDRP